MALTDSRHLGGLSEGQALQAVDDWGDVDNVVARVVREAQKRQWMWRWFLSSGRREGWWKAGINGSSDVPRRETRLQ